MRKIKKITKRIKRYWEHRLSDSLWRKMVKVDPGDSEYLFVFNHITSIYAEKLYSLAAYNLAERNIASAFLYDHDYSAKYLPKIEIDGITINNSLSVSQRHKLSTTIGEPPFFNWEVDLTKGVIMAEEINFYDIVISTLRRIQKRYNIEYENKDAHPNYEDLIASCDILLKTFQLLKKYAHNQNVKIRFVGWEVNYVPNGVLRMLCDQFSEDRDIELIEMERGYMSYFGHSIKDSYVCSANLTETKVLTGWVVNKNEFVNMKNSRFDERALQRTIESVVAKSGSEKSEKDHAILRLAGEYRNQGKNVFVLFAHLFYDTFVDDSSYEFQDMCDWILTTIEILNSSEDLLIIKPHPAELREDFPQKRPNETLASFIANVELGDNVVLLEPDQFSVNDLLPYITCSLIWRSSVAMELTYLGIPCIIAGKTYYNLLAMNYVKSKSEYQQLIQSAASLKVDDGIKEDIARYLHTQRNKNKFIDGIVYNYTDRRFYWNRKTFKRYLQNGAAPLNPIVENIL